MSTKTVTEKYENGKLVERTTVEPFDQGNVWTSDGRAWRYDDVKHEWFAAGGYLTPYKYPVINPYLPCGQPPYKYPPYKYPLSEKYLSQPYEHLFGPLVTW